MTRTANAIKNIKFSMLGQVIGILLNFLTRTIFVNILGAEYLGLNGLFTNILSILSFAELGIGSAIVYSMYKPLANKNEAEIRALMNLYKKAYSCIGIIIIVAGSILTPFLEFLIRDIPDILNIRILYLIFVVNSGTSYFFSYKRSLLIADQKKYIESIYYYLFYIIRNVLQIIFLIYTKQYIVYLLIQFIITFLENICISRKVDKMYPFIKVKSFSKLDLDVSNTIIKNIKAMIFHRVGSIAVTGTDNILISKFISIKVVGLYSNYLLIINALNQIYNLVFQSLIASIGNLGVTETNEKKEFIFKCIDFIGFWIFSFSSISLIILLNPFIKLWIGQDYIFNLSTVILIVISFYLTSMRKSVLTFRDALGLFWYDRYKPILEAALNLTASIILAKVMGLNGIVLGTIISTLFTCFWVEPYILYKYAFKSSVKSYFKKYLFNTFIAITVGILTWLISNLFSDYTLVGFFVKSIICLVVPNILFIIIFGRTKEFKYISNLIRPIIFKLINRIK